MLESRKREMWQNTSIKDKNSVTWHTFPGPWALIYKLLIFFRGRCEWHCVKKKDHLSWLRTSYIRKSQTLGQCLFQGWRDIWSSSLSRAAMWWASLARYQRLNVRSSNLQLSNLMVHQVPADEKEALTSDLMGKQRFQNEIKFLPNYISNQFQASSRNAVSKTSSSLSRWLWKLNLKQTWS